MSKTALIISTYNWPEALKMCLNSVLIQSVLPDEIIIADDGSDLSTKRMISSFLAFEKVQIKHVWHEHKGFRLAKIRNKAIKNTDCDYLIFIDGDIILHPDFIKDHINKRKQNTFIAGSRVLLSENETRKRIDTGEFKFKGYNYSARNRLNGIRSRFFSFLFSKTDTGIYNVRGCNMSFWKEDLWEVNGFDEQFTGWGREDSDITLRMLNSGKVKCKLKFSAIQYHLFHNEREFNSLEINDKILREAISENRKKAIIGLV